MRNKDHLWKRLKSDSLISGNKSINPIISMASQLVELKPEHI